MTSGPAPINSVIRKTPGVVGGSACIRHTRISVWLLVGWRRIGLSDATILEEYPSLTPEDLEAAWAYAEAHRAEIDARLREEDSDD